MDVLTGILVDVSGSMKESVGDIELEAVLGAVLAAGGVLQCSDILTYFLSYLSCRNTYFVLIDADFCRVSSDETYVWITSSIKLLFNVLFCHFLGFDGCLRHLA